MSKFYFNNVQKRIKSEKKREMQCLLQVVKWFTKCLLYSWLLKICIGLSLLFFFLFFFLFSFVTSFFFFLQMYWLSIPADCSCHRMHQTLQTVEAACAWRQKTGAHTTESDFFCLQISTSVSALIMWGMSINVSFTTGKHSARDRYIHPAICYSLRQRRAALASVSASVMSLISPRVKWLLFLHEHFFSSSHRNKKP